MQLHELVATSQAIAATRKRKAKIQSLAVLLSRLAPGEREVGGRFLSGEIRQGKIGIGYATVAKTTSVPAAEAPTLALLDVDATLDAIVATTGRGSAGARFEKLQALLRLATPDEQNFLRKLLIGELRQGALEGLLVDAVALAAELPATEVRRARMLSGDVGAVVIAALSQGQAGLERFVLTPFTPVHPMLAGTAASVEEALEKLETAALEVKLDGARVQVHKLGDDVRVYSRGLNEVTAAVPEVVELSRDLPVHSVILDGETIALDEDGRPRPFQETMRRYGRRLEVDRLRAEIPLSTFFFDVLLADGVDLLETPAEVRHARLSEIVPEPHRVLRTSTSTPEVARDFAARALDAGHEGLMAKSLTAPYAAGQRGAQWLKVKPVHTLDLLVLAAEWGSGRRKGWLSNLHLGARDLRGGPPVMLGKTFKGLTDELLAWQTEALLALETHREDHVVHVRPELVVEIAFDGLQKSPHYPGGLALRFARVKSYRADKRPADADTMDRVRSIASRQGTGRDRKNSNPPT